MLFRRLLKDISTGLYYTGDGGWAADAAKGYSFARSEDAVRTALKLGPKNLHLILKFADSRLDVSHPLGDTPAPQKPRLPGIAGGDLINGLFPAACIASQVIKKLVG